MALRGHDKLPGPIYNIPSRVAEGPKVHMHAKTDHVDQNVKKNVPGPGQYNLQNSPNNRHNQSASYGIGTSQRVDLGGGKEIKSRPAPGAYNQDRDMKRTAPSFGFGTEKRPELAKNRSPSPGQYEPKSITGKDGPSLTMSPMHKDNHKEKHDKLVPGPGQYEFHLKAMKTAPNYGFGTEKRKAPGNTISKGVTTEPGGYNPATTFTKNKSPDYKFGSDVRRMFDDKKMKANPGAGTYEIKSKAFEEKSKFHMGIKLHEQSKLVVPGAGTYEPDPSPIKNKASAYSMGAKLKSDLIKSAEVPGPGTYVNAGEKFKQSAPSFGFGSSKRPDIGGNTKFQTPGPGNYKVPSKIADVPNYAYQRDDKSKYI